MACFSRQRYFRELLRLQGELVKLQDCTLAIAWSCVRGRDAAGKAASSTHHAAPESARMRVAAGATSRERTQWYFQRYGASTAAGEIVLFDRSWYNRAGVERVMGFCNDAEYEEFFAPRPSSRRCWPAAASRSSSTGSRCRTTNRKPASRAASTIRSHAGAHSHPLSRPGGSCGRRQEKARLNCITHLLDQVPYLPVDHPEVQLPERVHHEDYLRHPVPSTCSCRTAIERPAPVFRLSHSGVTIPIPGRAATARHRYAMSADHDDDIDGSRL